jgi:large subunit ribosomal protein L21
MFAVVRTGGKQYRVAAGDKIAVEKIPGEAGDAVTLGDVLLAGTGADVKAADGLTVAAEIVAQAKGEKVIIFKKRRRHNYRRKAGHRQQYTILRITAIGDHKPDLNKAEAAAPVAAVAPAPADQPAEAPKKAPRAKAAAAEAPAEGLVPQDELSVKSEPTESPMVDSPKTDSAPEAEGAGEQA